MCECSTESYLKLGNSGGLSPCRRPTHHTSIVVGFAVLKTSAPEQGFLLSLIAVFLDRWLMAHVESSKRNTGASEVSSPPPVYLAALLPMAEAYIRLWQPRLVRLRLEWVLQRQPGEH